MEWELQLLPDQTIQHGTRATAPRMMKEEYNDRGEVISYSRKEERKKKPARRAVGIHPSFHPALVLAALRWPACSCMVL